MPTPDASELSALLARYERPLVRYAQSITSDLEAARDVVQETFIKLARGEMKETRKSEGGSRNGSSGTPSEIPNSDRLPGDSGTGAEPHFRLPTSDFRVPHVEAWLFTVTRNRALDHQRKFSRIIPMPLPEDRPCSAPGPAAVLERRESATSLFRLLDALSPNQREVIRLKFQNDLSYREIADITQLSVTNVGFLLHTGLKKLRELLREQPSEDFGLPTRSVL
jgi:RNA polymerase sigma-70 factor (ECF subfamily)